MNEILKIVSRASNKGAFLELIIEDVFKDQEFTNVRRQRSGSQFGFDVIGYKNGKCWKAECKNLNKETTINDIAPKLLWHIESTRIDRFVIVSINGISNDLHRLIESKLFSFPIEIWHSDYLAQIISQSPNALNRLGITLKDNSINETSGPLIFLPNDLKLGVVYSKGTPFSYDYFSIDSELIKAYTEVDFSLIATLSNRSNKVFAIDGITVKTLRFKRTDHLRVLRQFTQKGFVEQIKLTFTPKTYPNSEVELIEGKLIEVKAHSDEYIEFKLSRKCLPGYYELLFQIHCIEGERRFTLFSPIFPLHKTSMKDDIVNLCVVGKFYDTPVPRVLDLTEKEWLIIKKEHLNQIKYLGPTLIDTIKKTNQVNTWLISTIKGKRKKIGKGYSLDINPNRKSSLLLDLRIPIDEEIYSNDSLYKDFAIR